MNRNLAIVLMVFAVMYFGTIIIGSGAVAFETPFFASGELSTGVNHIVELKDGIVILSSSSTSVKGVP